MLKQILCLSYLPWQAQPNRTQQLLTRLADAEVLFFEPPVSRGMSQPEQGRRMRSHITVYTLPSPILPNLEQPMLQRRNLNRMVDFIRQTMAEHRFREPLLWCTSPEQVIFLERFPCRGVVYDCHQEWGEDFLDLESVLTSRAEVIFAASAGLMDRLSPCSDNIALLPNGVNPTMFFRSDLTPPPAVSALVGKKVFGRVGDLTSQVELAPMLAAARTRPEWQFLLIGRVTRQAAARMADYPNIHLLGPVNTVELPDYLSVCSVLFDLIQTDLRGCDILPSRIYEYLATGKPIVMMTEPDQVEPFPDVIYTAYDAAGFLRRCTRALEETPHLAFDRRRECAQRSSWAVRAAEIMRILEDTGLF